ncbi:hypothetical protein HYT55_05445 [Candidatus Woesearchaeota archaeon]|nr:hypothetical protein [Candidatus Woesearchaeota archaeon]
MKTSTQTIIIDTNALMAVGEQKIDIFIEIEKICMFQYKLAVLSGTVDELIKIQQEQRGKYKTAAKIALMLLEIKNIAKIPSSEYVDDELVKLSQKGKLVLTQDKELKKKLTKPYLTIRQGKKVVLIE